MALTHRLQLLLADEQYRRLADRAQAEGRSIGAVVREAIDLAWPDFDLQRQAAAERILNATPMQVPDVDDLRAELDEARAGRFA